MTRTFIPGLLILLALPASGDFPTTRPYPAIEYHFIQRDDPPQRICVATVDLTSPTISLRVSRGGDDPDAEGKWQTVLQPSTEIAKRERFDLTVNGDFFAANKVKDAEGAQAGYVKGVWAAAIGPAATDGKQWSTPEKPRPALLVLKGNTIKIETVKELPSNVLQAVAGSHVLIRGGRVVVENQGTFSKTRHPRTAVGIADGGRKLVLVVVDGRKAGVASGMSLTELAELMLTFGCESALNLDGGGSSQMTMRDPETGKLEVMNTPSDGRERAVANVLGVSVEGAKRD